jgi:hypothetical protein
MSALNEPRAASARVVGGPPDLLGEEIVRVENVTINGNHLLVPQALPGASEYATVFRSEVEADRLLTEVLDTDNVDYRGAIPSADITLAMSFRETAGTAVASAATGLEAFANFHIGRVVPSEKEQAELRNRRLNERYAEDLPAILDKPRPTDERWWPMFRQIQGLAALQRHGVTGPQTRKGLEGKRSLNQRLYGREYQGGRADDAGRIRPFCARLDL